jgi:hypothetical protein
MTTDLQAFDRRYRIAAVRTRAERLGMTDQQIGNLLDSSQFCDRLDSLDVESPGFGRQVGDLISGAAPSAPSQPATQASGAQGAAGSEPRQWTEADILALPKTREGAQALNEAAAAGLLTDLGYGLPRYGPNKQRLR